MHKLKFYFFLFLIVIGVYTVNLLVDAGVFTKLHPHFKGQCVSYNAIAGAEDMEFSKSRQTLFISSDFRPESEGDSTPNGELYIWTANEISRGDSPPHKSSWGAPFSFHPHGLGLLDGPEGPRLWVVNHRTAEETSIEVFDFIKGQLVHVTSIFDPTLTNANDIAPVDRETFYVTLDHRGKSNFQKKIEDYLRLGLGKVIFFDGKKFEAKASGIQFANGIQLTKDRLKLFVASMTSKFILIYRRHPMTNDLEFIEKKELPSAPDNLTLDDTEENLWIGAHPKLLALAKQMHHHQIHAPAQVLRMNLKNNSLIEEIFLDDGKQISSTSVAVKIGKNLILGSIFGDNILKCQPVE